MGFINRLKELRDGYVISQVKHINFPDFAPSPNIRNRIIFSGRVQNVGFRLEIYEIAKQLNLTGWVKNREDKNVEAEIQGEKEKLDFLIKFMKSLKRASVQDVTISEIPVIDNETDFVLLKG